MTKEEKLKLLKENLNDFIWLIVKECEKDKEFKKKLYTILNDILNYMVEKDKTEG